MSARLTATASGTIGEREWATPLRPVGVHTGGQSPPFMPRSTECTVRSLETATMPSYPTVGGTIAVAPVA
jgi:hypothetical protein